MRRGRIRKQGAIQARETGVQTTPKLPAPKEPCELVPTTESVMQEEGQDEKASTQGRRSNKDFDQMSDQKIKPSVPAKIMFRGSS